MSVISYEERESDSPFIHTISTVRAERDGFAIIPADGHLYLYVRKQNGQTSFTVGGPITTAMSVPQVAGTEWLGVRLKLGLFMPNLPATKLVDTETMLPDASSKTFWLNGRSWQYPDYENVETFIDWLVRDEVLVHEPIVDAVLKDHPQDMSLRSLQRRFLRATGVTHSYVRQIQRAQQAVTLLQQGVSILDTVYEAGYFDQPHLTRSLKQLMGQTPAQIARTNSPMPLSF